MSGHEHHHHHHGSGRMLLFSLLFTAMFAAVELVGGYWAHSLALLSDAGHMITDSSSLAIGALAAWVAMRPASREHSFGFQRAEVLGALLNVLLMFVVVALIVLSAIERLGNPGPVGGATVLVIATVGLAVNLAIGWILMRSEQTINVRGALLHVFGDMLGSVAAMVAGLVILLTGWTPIDPLLSLFVSLLILVSAARLLREVLRVLMEAVPRDVNAQQVRGAICAVDGVRDVHDLHIWTLSSDSYALAAHVEVDDMGVWASQLAKLQTLLRQQFRIAHSTLQPEDAAGQRACDADPECGAGGRTAD